jgi:hypothetical protein
MSTLPQAMTLHEQNQALLVEFGNSRDRFLSLLGPERHAAQMEEIKNSAAYRAAAH